MTDDTPSPETLVSFPLPGDNILQTFTLERPNIRGRVLRMGRLIDDILRPLKYPDRIATVTGETISLAVLLSSMLKYDGIFILQAKGDGAINRLVADVTSDGAVRGCAGFDADKLAALPDDAAIGQMMGKGYMAFTVDQGDHTERYQGIVGLEGATLKDCVHHYFNQSEQIRTAIRVAVQKTADGWRAGAVMLQHMPYGGNIPQDHKPQDTQGEEDWKRASLLLETATDEELLDPRLHENTLLFRLFHEEGVRVYTPTDLTKGCRCTMEKLQGIIAVLSEDDRRDIVVDGKIGMNCEFCNKEFLFNPDGTPQV